MSFFSKFPIDKNICSMYNSREVINNNKLEAIDINNNTYSRLPAYARWQQRLYERCDALDDACYGLRTAIEALRCCAAAPEIAAHADELTALEDIAAGLARSRDDLAGKLSRLEAMEQRALAREHRRDTL